MSSASVLSAPVLNGVGVSALTRVPGSVRGRAVPCEDAFLSSGPSPTRSLHLLGVGKVGQAFLRQFPVPGPTLCGVTDSTATVWRRQGLDASALADGKAAGGRLRDQEGARRVEVSLLAQVCGVDAFVDCVATRGDPLADYQRARSVLGTGAALVLASKDALAHAPRWFFEEVAPERLGLNAVLGGTGAALQAERKQLRRDCHGLRLVANATSTVVLESLERGAAPGDAIAEARHRGLLEGDPSEDLDGWDAARKLVIVAAAVLDLSVRVEEVARPSFADLDLDEVRARARQGRTTRLVGRACQEEGLRLAYEPVSRDSSLAVPGSQVAYCYERSRGQRRLHVGRGLGPQRTAGALWQDLRRLWSQGVAR